MAFEWIHDTSHREAFNKKKPEVVVLTELNAIQQVGIGLTLLAAFSWRYGASKLNFESILASDKETNDILVDEDKLMRFIQLINTSQETRKLRFVSTKEMTELRHKRSDV